MEAVSPSISSFYPPALLGTPGTRVLETASRLTSSFRFEFFSPSHGGRLSPLCLQILEGSAHPVTPGDLEVCYGSFYVAHVPS